MLLLPRRKVKQSGSDYGGLCLTDPVSVSLLCLDNTKVGDMIWDSVAHSELWLAGCIIFDE